MHREACGVLLLSLSLLLVRLRQASFLQMCVWGGVRVCVSSNEIFTSHSLGPVGIKVSEEVED